MLGSRLWALDFGPGIYAARHALAGETVDTCPRAITENAAKARLCVGMGAPALKKREVEAAFCRLTVGLVRERAPRGIDKTK